MIQELLGGGRGVENCIGEEKKVANVNMSESGGGSSSDQQQLRCPRCDSSNTKFCYYNNYNLTQPRHFCKTCRRYWTKGGALRNVPIGGGCRKNKSSGSNSASGTSSSNTKSGKIKSDLAKPNSVISLDHEITWGSAANSQLFDLHSPAVGSSQHALSLALLRASIQSPNPNSSSNPNAFLTSEPVAGVLNSQALTLDPMIPVPTSVGGGSLWRSNINQQQQQQGLFGCEVQSGGIQDFYQRLRASANFCNSDHNSHSHSHSLSHHQGLNTVSTILDPTPFPSSELGYWNYPLSWSDLHTANGAFP